MYNIRSILNPLAIAINQTSLTQCFALRTALSYVKCLLFIYLLTNNNNNNNSNDNNCLYSQ